MASVDPHDPAAVARLQAEIRYCGFFTDGDIAEALKNEVIEKTKERMRQDNG